VHSTLPMVRSALVLIALVAAPAWAVGERISVPKGAVFADQLKETLCISMECGAGIDASITAKVIKGNKVELKVFAATGNLKATVTAPLNADGRISSMDLVAATSGLIAGIEASDPGKQAPAAKDSAKAKKGLASKAKKKSSFKMAAKSRSGHSRG
jgi:hypothetical protein